MANVTTPTESTLPVAGGDIIAAPLSGWITNLKNFVEGANIDENNVDYTSFDGIVVKAQTQTLSGAKTFSSAITASAGLITGGVIISDTDSTDDLGSTTKRFANLYVDSIGDTGQDLTIAATTTNLPSGHITDYNSADVTITHAANTLTIAGGNTVVDSLTSGGNIVSDTDSTDDLGTTSVRWANLYVDDITVTNNVAIGGTLSLTGGLTLNGNVTVGDNASDTLTINSTITSNLLFTDNTYDIGASGATRPRDLFLSRNAVMGGTLGVTGLITATGGVSGALTGDVTGNLTGNVTGNVTGNLTGDVTGNISGNVTGGTISGTTGTFTGALTGTTGTFASTGTGDIVVVETSDDTSTAGPILCLLRESTSPADGDYLGQIKFKGRNDAGQQLIYAKITAKTSDVTDTTEDSLIEIAVKADGSNRIVSRQKHDCLQLVNGTGLDVNGVTTLEDALNGTTASFSSTIATTGGYVTVAGNPSAAAISSNGNGQIGGLTGNGLYMYGKGSTYDLALANANTSVALAIPTGGSALPDVYIPNLLGIGTSSPSTKIHASGASSASALRLDESTSGANSYLGYLDTSGNFGIDVNGGGYLRFAVGGAERARIDSSGNLLLGRTAASLTLLGGEMTTDGILRAVGSSTSTNLGVNAGGRLNLANNSATDGNFSCIGGYNSNGLVTSQIDFINVSHSSRTGDIAFLTHTGSTMLERLRITSAGNVGIGTTSPSGVIHADAASGVDGPIFDSGGTGNTNHALLVRDSGNNQLFRVNNDGKVGIGTTSPAAPLHLIAGTPSTTSDAFHISDGTYTNIVMRSGAADGEIRIGAAGTQRGRYAAQYAGTRTGHNFSIGTNDTTAITVDTSQRVGIGASSPSEVLDVAGAVKASATATNWGYSASFFDRNGDATRISAGATSGNSSNITFHTYNSGSHSEKVRILSSGGITFNGDTSTANALDDYEEGTWTITDQSGAGITFTTNSNNYTKIGRLVFVALEISSISATGAAQFSISLPFTSAASGGRWSFNAVTNSTNTTLSGYLTSNSTNVVLVESDTSPATITNASMNGYYLVLTGCYEAA